MASAAEKGLTKSQATLLILGLVDMEFDKCIMRKYYGLWYVGSAVIDETPFYRDREILDYPLHCIQKGDAA
ncbi:unnamed protein product [Lupinus luteus]|uniref:Uncharacterized protein n=1 Tax=Lupinus luteus TaxID=3873 RepID=A0AAV1WR78_LUPLU